MPFKSEKQRRLCWLLYNRDIQAGKTPKWDCAEWAAETKKEQNRIKRKSSRKNSKKSSRKSSKRK